MAPTVGNGHGGIPHDRPQDHRRNAEHGHVRARGYDACITNCSSPGGTVHYFSTLRDAHRRVRNATRSSARTQKSYYDERAHVISFDVGQLVWLYWPRPPVRQRFRKLQRLWTGTWRIEAFKSPLVVVIKHTVKRTRQTVHVDRLLVCKTPPPTVPDVDSGVIPDLDRNS